MAAYWKPGSRRPQQPLSLDVDRDGSEPGTVFGAFLIAGGPANLSIRDQQDRLPIAKHRLELLYLLETNATTVLIGQTGSGKTTQVPQYLVEAGWAAEGRQVACTQPRRVAAQTVAARVAEEMRVVLGQEVGYTIRFDDVTTPGVTRIKYLTDGVLLREMLVDPLLTRYSVVMVDEAHERSVATDMVLGLLKKIQRRRPDLRLIISSATLDVDALVTFFDTSKEKRRPDTHLKNAALPNRTPAILSVEGRSYPVRLFHLEQPCPDYLQAAVHAVGEIHRRETTGDILVFLTGQEEVETAVQLIEDEQRERKGKDSATRSGSTGIVALPLYAGLPRPEQERVFAPAPFGKRKVIVATNIAETSLTLEGTVYVVDCGFSKQRFFNPITGLDALVVAPISRASAQQRAGRAGRVRPGKCFRLYTEPVYDSLPVSTAPEIQRSDLAPCVLQLKALGIDNIMRFDFLSSPPAEAMVRALELLFALGFLDVDARLTKPAGLTAAEIPLEPMLCRMLLAAADLGCSEECLTIAAMLCVQSVWLPSRGRQRELDEARARFAVAEGDHITFLNVYKAYLDNKRAPSWCHRHCLNHRALQRVGEVRTQLASLLRRLGLPLASSGTDMRPVLRAITSGFFANAARLQADGERPVYNTLYTSQTVRIHPSSVLFRCSPRCVVFHTLIASGQRYITEVAAIDTEWLPEVAPHFYHKRRLREPG